jgi:predicted Zn-dependent protease with MMP-like domain
MFGASVPDRLAVLLCGWVIGSAAGCDQCESPISSVELPVDQARLSAVWSDPSHARLSVVVAERPYAFSSEAIDWLVRVLREQMGVEVDVVSGADAKLPADGRLTAEQVITAGLALVPNTTHPVVVLIEVGQFDVPGATFGFVHYQDASPPVAVVCVSREAALDWQIGPITPEVIEAMTLVHEMGHWFGVPARDHHLSAVDGQHCTHARCVMYKGSRVGPCAVLANLLTGPPLGFCQDCAEELAEMARLRSLPAP